MDKLIGPEGIYPSRSGLIRSAVREYLIHMISNLRKGKNTIQDQLDENESEKKEEVDDDDLVRIPINNGFKVFKVIRRLE